MNCKSCQSRVTWKINLKFCLSCLPCQRQTKSKKIYRPKMIVRSGAIFSLRWYCFRKNNKNIHFRCLEHLWTPVCQTGSFQRRELAINFSVQGFHALFCDIFTCGFEVLSMIMFEPSCLYKTVTKMTSVTKASPSPPLPPRSHPSINHQISPHQVPNASHPPPPTKIKASQNTKLPHSPNIKWPSAKYQMSPELSNTSLDMKYTQISNVLQIMMWKSCSCKTSEIDLGKHWRGLAWERPVILLQNVSPPLSLAFSLSLHFTLMFSCFLSLSLSLITQNFPWTHNLLSKKRHGSVYCGRSSCWSHRGGEDSIALFNHLVFINSQTWKEIGRVGDFLWDHGVPPNWITKYFSTPQLA